MNARKTRRALLNVGLCLASALPLLGGCTADPEHKDIPPAEVKTVQAYGLTLDENASPQQVTYVLLRAIADDVKSAQAQQNPSLSGEARRELREKQKAAMKTTYALAAYSVIEKRVLEVLNLSRVDKKQSLGDERDQQLYDFVHQWAPIVAYYVPSFPTDFADALTRMPVVTAPDGKRAEVTFEASHNPTASSDKDREPVTMAIELAKEPGAGGKEYWRVARVGYLGRPGVIRALPTTRIAATAPASRPKP
jgi:hypothetical protein